MKRTKWQLLQEVIQQKGGCSGISCIEYSLPHCMIDSGALLYAKNQLITKNFLLLVKEK